MKQVKCVFCGVDWTNIDSETSTVNIWSRWFPKCMCCHSKKVPWEKGYNRV